MHRVERGGGAGVTKRQRGCVSRELGRRESLVYWNARMLGRGAFRPPPLWPDFVFFCFLGLLGSFLFGLDLIGWRLEGCWEFGGPGVLGWGWSPGLICFV